MFIRCTTQVQRSLIRSVTTSTPSRDSLAPPAVAAQPKETPIEIPKRIPRSPTDILYALSSTVGSDPTAAHYKYHDDPYLIPTSNMSKRIYALAQESGRKAAMWIKEKHKDYFLHKEAQPYIQRFAPKMVFDENSEVDEEILRELILHSELTDAVFVYELMKGKGVALSEDVKQSLLELVCFYNNEEPQPEDLIEERWFKQSMTGRQAVRSAWKDRDLAEKLFDEIEPKTAASYAALIRGMAKFRQAERAYNLFQEANEKGMLLDTTTYNYIIAGCMMLKESAGERWELCLHLLHCMNEAQLRPNVRTLNAVMECISSFGNYKYARSTALKALGEFKSLGITPSAATYYYVLNIFCRDRAPTSYVLVDILNELQGKEELQIVDPKDSYFFATAMDVCRNQLHDASLAARVHDLLHTGNNYNLIGDSYKESVYYRHYFALLCETQTMEVFMQTYDRLVPHIYIPEPGIMEGVLNAVEMSGAIDLLPRLWSDMVVFNHTTRDSLLTGILRIMVENPPHAEIFSQQNLAPHFANIATNIYKIVVEQKENVSKKLYFTGPMIGNILTLLARGDDFDMAVEVFVYLERNQHRIPGSPTEACMVEFIEVCVRHKAPSQAMHCLQYCVENSMDGLTLARAMAAGFTLNEVHISKIQSLVGDKFLSTEETTHNTDESPPPMNEESMKTMSAIE